ncbi:jerky protein homolog [Latimeria chalumnae]|uniref:jerky protein homolog n=1 Tax=Latimeria chalumnae TaxID=7897 RepID=UPI00313D0576
MADPKRSYTPIMGGSDGGNDSSSSKSGKRPLSPESSERVGAKKMHADGKRQRNVLSIQQKVELLKKLDHGVSVAQLREDYGVGQSIIYDLRGQKDKILKFYSESDSVKGMAKRKTLRGPQSSDLDNVLYEWFRQRHCQGVPVSGPMLMEKAKAYHSEMKIEGDCNYSTGWLQKFKNCHGIRHLKASGEKLSADHEAAEKYVEDFARLVTENDLTAEQIYNTDKTGLFWRCLPRNTLVCNDENSASGVKESKERLTVLTCANAASTHKCKLLVIGKSARPRAFKGVKVFPVIYQSNKRAWITQELTSDWFDNSFVEAREHCRKVGLPENCKIVLLLDNCSAHPAVETMVTRNVFATYLPPNCTSLIQPMDQGIIRYMKCHYRSEFMQKLVNHDGPDGYESFKKIFTIKDAVWCVARAWDAVLPPILKLAWRNIWPATMFSEDDDDASGDSEGFKISQEKSDIAELMTYAKGLSDVVPDLNENDVEKWIDCDFNAPVHQTLTDSEIIDVILNPNTVESDNSDDGDEQEVSQEKMTMTEGIDTFTRLINFLEQKSFITQQEIMQMYRIQDKLIKERPNCMKQTTLMALFQKASNDCVRQSKVTPTPSPIPLPDDTELELMNLTVSDESPAPSTSATTDSTVSSPVAST